MQLVTFRIGEREYALPLDAVERIVRAAEVTPLPEAPDGVVGVVNVSGNITPVVCLRAILGLPDREMALSDQFIIVHQAQRSLVLWVESVGGVIDYPEHKVVKTGDILAGAEAIEGMVRLEQGIVLIANLNGLFRMTGPSHAG